jgi:hypothetical protein
LTDELLLEYRKIIESLDPQSQIRDAMQKLLHCCEQWWNQPESTGDGKPHPSGRGVIVDLDKSIADALWEHIPWDDELKAFAALFDKLDPVAEANLRNAAFHLLWHAKELELDREPITTDKL